MGPHPPEAIPSVQPDCCLCFPIFLTRLPDASPPHPKVLLVPPQQKTVRKPCRSHPSLLGRNGPGIWLGIHQNPYLVSIYFNIVGFIAQKFIVLSHQEEYMFVFRSALVQDKFTVWYRIFLS